MPWGFLIILRQLYRLYHDSIVVITPRPVALNIVLFGWESIWGDRLAPQLLKYFAYG
ncbi:MAG: hypothetical protein WBB82_08500 [Limnothrix sp.]